MPTRRAQPRSYLSRLASNTAIGLGGNAVQRTLTFVITLVLARGLGEEDFGRYSYVTAYVFLFGFLADLGIERVVTREVARRPADAGVLLGSALAVKFTLSLGATAAAILTAFALGLEGETLVCVIVAAIGLPMTIEHVFRGYFQSRYQAAYTYLTTMPGTLWFLLVALAVTRWHWPLYSLFALGLALAPLIVAGLFWVARYRMHLVFHVRRATMLRLLRESAELGGFIGLFLLSMRLDQILLFHLRGDGELALYAVGVRLGEALGIIPEAAVMTIFPLLASSEHRAPERFRATYRLGFKYLAATGVFVAFTLTLLRHEIVRVMYGAAFAEAAMPVAILGWNTCFAYLGVIHISLFVAQSRQRALMGVSLVALLVNIALNLALIPGWGASGAALGALLANVVGFVCWIVLRPTRPFMLTALNESWRAGLAIALVAGVIWALDLGPLPSVAVLIVSYPALLWAIGGLTWDDVHLVRRLFAEDLPHESHPS